MMKVKTRMARLLRAPKVLLVILKTFVSIVYNTRNGFEPGFWTLLASVYLTDRNSLSIWFLVLESQPSPLEKWSKELERLQVSMAEPRER